MNYQIQTNFIHDPKLDSIKVVHHVCYLSDPIFRIIQLINLDPFNFLFFIIRDFGVEFAKEIKLNDIVYTFNYLGH